MFELEEILESEGFWILLVVGVGMEIMGWFVSKNMIGYSFPLWQLIILILGTIVASFFWVGMLKDG
jgi:FtsH-binding integral membrane protein